ncbi:MAG: winged helix-turn-helix domain-containing protein, partial [Treponema sp.]|nr:winged helix-turn-helix domain-containing protein [Treponema sp.]
GKSMFINKMDFEIEAASSFRIEAKPFEETQAEQFKILPMEKISHLVDFSSLKDIAKWYKSFLSPLRRLTDAKKTALVNALEERINEAKILLAQKQKEKQYSLKHEEPQYVGVYEVEVEENRGPKSKAKSTEIVYASLVQDPTQTKEILSERLGLSRATITRALQKLREEGKILRNGSNKTGRWEIVG